MRLNNSTLFAAMLALSGGVQVAHADLLYSIVGPYVGTISAIEQIGSNSDPESDFPFNGSTTVTATVGSYQSSTQFTAASDSLTIDANNARDGGNATTLDYSFSYWDIFFTPTENVSYTVDAQYSASNPTTVLIVGLNDATQSSTLLSGLAEVDSPSSGSQNLDLSTDPSDYTGSLTGTLTAGDEYEFTGGASVVASLTSVDSGATGNGAISIDFAPIPTGPASVPLPATFATSAALLSLVAAYRRYKPKIA